MSAIHTLPTANRSFVEMRTVLRLSLNATFVLLSTFMTAFPAEFTKASCWDVACDAVTKLGKRTRPNAMTACVRRTVIQIKRALEATLNDNSHRVAVGEVVNYTIRFREAREGRKVVTQQFP
jgi:hypothetical protein